MLEEGGAPEDVGRKRCVRRFLLQGRCPVHRCEIEHLGDRPAGQQTEEIAQIRPRLDAMHRAAGQQRDEDGVHPPAILRAHEEPVAAPHRLAAQVEFGEVVVDRQPRVVEKPLERRLLIGRVADGVAQRRPLQGGVSVFVAPSKELLDDGLRLLGADPAYSDESERLIRRRRTQGPMMAITVGAKRREWSVAR